MAEDRTEAIRKRVEAASVHVFAIDDEDGEVTPDTRWAIVEVASGCADCADPDDDGGVCLTEADVRMLGNAAADERHLLDEIDRLGALHREAVERAEYWQRTAAQIDDALGAKTERIAGERTHLRRLANHQDRLILALLSGQDHAPALMAVNEAKRALGWGLTEIGEGTVPAVLRELVQALDARALVETQSLREMSVDDGETAVVAELFVKQGDAEIRVMAAWEAARALVPEVAT